jgi:hypothetical protein
VRALGWGGENNPPPAHTPKKKKPPIQKIQRFVNKYWWSRGGSNP